MNRLSSLTVIAACWTTLTLPVLVLGQARPKASNPGIFLDWSHRHVLFSPGENTALRAKVASTQDLRVHQEWLLRTYKALSAARYSPLRAQHDRTTPSNVSTDWSMSLGRATVADGNYPAVFVSDPEHASCSDWIVFGLDTEAHTNGQANLVAFTNLYVSGSHGSGPSGICETPGTHTNPQTKFGLNVTTVPGGVIKTSPVLSLVGDKIAFVESASRHGTIFHVLTVAGNTSGRARAAAAPAPGTLASVVLSANTDDSFASPWIDYVNDVAYVATDDGVLHKITGVFLGVPEEVKSGPWPLTVAAGRRLVSPVLDFVSDKIFVAASNGGLYSVACIPSPPAASTSCLVSSSAATVAPNSIFDAPIVDSGSQRVYWFSDNGGDNADPDCIERNNRATQPVLIQTDTSLAVQATASLVIGGPETNGQISPAGRFDNNDDDNKQIIHTGTFDNDYYTTGKGNLWVCGLTHGSEDFGGGLYPTLLRFTVQDGTLETQPNASLIISRTNHDGCSGPSEVFNGLTDMFFVGTGKTGIVGDETCTIGCIQSFTFAGGGILRLAVAAENGLSSGIVMDNTDLSSPQAASIYFARPGDDRAVKLTQAGLQ